MGLKQITDPRWSLGLPTLQKLGQKKFRQSTGLYLLEGTAAVTDALRAGALIRGVVHDSRVRLKAGDRKALVEIERSTVPLREIGSGDLKRMSGLSTPPSIIAVIEKPEETPPSLPPRTGLTLALDRINDPGNTGTILRAAAFYGVKEVWLGKGTAELYNPKTLRAAMSAHLQLDICQDVDLECHVAESGEAGAVVYAAVLNGDDSTGVTEDRERRIILMLGSEAHGLTPNLAELADRKLTIKRIGPVDSLNVALAGAILLDRLLGKDR